MPAGVVRDRAGALAGALIGDGDGSYIAGGALAGAALGASSNGGDCDYYRGGHGGYCRAAHCHNRRQHHHYYCIK